MDAFSISLKSLIEFPLFTEFVLALLALFGINLVALKAWNKISVTGIFVVVFLLLFAFVGLYYLNSSLFNL